LCVLNRLEGCGQFERAAAVGLFNNKIQEAINILSSKRTNDNLGEKGEIGSISVHVHLVQCTILLSLCM